MLTIVTLLGHSRDNLVRLVTELRHMVADWVVVCDNGLEAPELTRGFWADKTDGFDAGAMRRLAMEQVHTDWVFHLDSDEWYSPLQLNTLLHTLKTCPKEVDCIKLPRRNIEPSGDWIGWPDARPCVHRNKKYIFWQGRLEEWPMGCKQMQQIEDVSSAILHLHLDTAARNIMTEARKDAESRSKSEQNPAKQ